MESTLKRTWAEISLDNLTHNFETIRRQVGPKAKLLGVVKADAYGHGAVRVAKHLERLGAGYLAVSNLDECEELRVNGITLPILMLGFTPADQAERISELTQDVICITSKGRPVKPKTIGQKQYVDAIMQDTVTIGVGPAGTGKTYLAVAAAVAAFRDKQVNRIILTRPAVEAGERLGFLPGDLQSKVDPYLRPLYDALFDMLGAETYQKYLERGNIEVAPLAYMRGRTLDDSFIILDEAQNTSREQMKMFLTRMGFGSKVVITGDVTQIDLPTDKVSGLKEAMKVLRDVEGVAICRLTKEDVVRHVMVQRIIEAYAKFEEKKK